MPRSEPSENSNGTKRTLTREEMHRLVWSTPMTMLAERYGVSEKALRRICSVHLIPAPPRGYWKDPSEATRRRSRLQPVENEALQTIAIAERYSPPAGDYTKVVLQELEPSASDKIVADRAKSAPLERRSGVTPMKAPEALKVAETPPDEERPPQSPSVVKDPAVSEFMSALRLKDVDRDGYIMLKWVKIPPNKIARVGALLHRLAEALRPDNLVFDASQGRVGFSRGGSTVDFEITFPRQQIMVRNPYSNYEHREYRHIGRMNLRIYGHAEGARKNFNDGDTKGVEDYLDKLAESFRLNMVAEVERDEKRREEEQMYARRARRRELAALRAKREDERGRLLREIATVRREIGEVVEAVSVLEPMAPHSPDLSRMLEWSQAHLVSLMGRLSPGALQARLADEKLFPEVDELVDPEDAL